MTAVVLGMNPMASFEVVQQLPQQTPRQMLAPISTLGTLPDRRIKEERGYNSIDENNDDLRARVYARACVSCGTTSSTSWEKADVAGNGKTTSEYLCSPCANNWMNRQHAVAQAKAKTEHKKSTREAPTASKKERRDPPQTHHNHPDTSHDEYYEDFHDSNGMGPLKERGVGGGIGGGENNYYCRYCDTTWPLTYFRNRQQFGAHCSNCSRKRKPRDEPNPDPPARQRKKVRARKHSISPTYDDSAAECSSYDEDDLPSPKYGTRHDDSSPTYSPRSSGNISPSSFERGLLERLLNVVENKLVEVNELEMIRKELQIMKSELLQREDRRQSRLGEVKNMIVHGVSELRLKMAEQLSHKEGICKKELEQMRDGMMVEFVLKERVIRNMLEGSTHENHAIVQQQLQDMRTSFESKLEDMKSKMGNDLNGMEKLVASGIMKCETNIQDLLSELSSELNYQLEEVRMRFVSLEKVIKDDPRIRSAKSNRHAEHEIDY